MPRRQRGIATTSSLEKAIELVIDDSVPAETLKESSDLFWGIKKEKPWSKDHGFSLSLFLFSEIGPGL